MRKYNRTAIRNFDNKTAITKQNTKEPSKRKEPWWKNISSKLKNECSRMIKLNEKFTKIYEDHPELFLEKQIVLQVFLSTCSMASCSRDERWAFNGETNESKQEPWVLKDTERYILNFIKENYPQEWKEMLHEGDGVQYWHEPVQRGIYTLDGNGTEGMAEEEKQELLKKQRHIHM